MRRSIILLLLLPILFITASCFIKTQGLTEENPTEEEIASSRVSDEVKFFKAPFVEIILFGYWKGEPFTSDWIETRQIPYREGRFFGWRMKLREPHPKYVRIIERMTVPAPPSEWGLLENRHLVSSDRLVATVPNQLKVRDHWIHRANWMLNQGDQLGEHSMEIQVNGRLAARLQFELVQDTQQEESEVETPEDEVDQGEEPYEDEGGEPETYEEPEATDDPSGAVEEQPDPDAIAPAEQDATPAPEATPSPETTPAPATEPTPGESGLVFY